MVTKSLLGATCMCAALASGGCAATMAVTAINAVSSEPGGPAPVEYREALPAPAGDGTSFMPAGGEAPAAFDAQAVAHANGGNFQTPGAPIEYRASGAGTIDMSGLADVAGSAPAVEFGGMEASSFGGAPVEFRTSGVSMSMPATDVALSVPEVVVPGIEPVVMTAPTGAPMSARAMATTPEFPDAPSFPGGRVAGAPVQLSSLDASAAAIPSASAPPLTAPGAEAARRAAGAATVHLEAPAQPWSPSAILADRPGEVIVQPGETLFGLSESYMVSLRALIEANALEPPFMLQTGAALALPAPNAYGVSAGDTLYSIARRHRVHFHSLANLNGIREPYAISPGQQIVLPALARDWEERAAPAAQALPARPPASGGAAQFAWPVDGAVLSRFGPQEGGGRNDGVNIRAAQGAPVRAAADGVIAYVGEELAGYGKLVLVQHDDGWVSAYAHNRSVGVRENQRVRRGETIAEAGASGSVDTTQLHFEVRRNGQPVDPLTVMPRRGG